ncbi:hypothetical protein MIZ01_2620 [Sideroxyarcus emersonii]|uniref:Uncharacterized protein n=1 Tax=Sideroxyarcus emersonii TaxID=2764705 RepID=A0AAN1XCZ2_9PROT|nr:hypothetical protein [Sideroxyarcus emersonii]BCK88814.1 hypothetical protein MIZ01_2620 [Sideroxyarcus emersonii]
MERISILFSILLAGYLSWSIFKGKALAFKFVSALILFTSTVALTGFISGSLGQRVDGIAVFFGSMISLILGKILINLDSKKTLALNVPDLSASQALNHKGDKSSWVFLCAFLGWAVLNLYLSSWQIIPQSVSVDSAAHYSLVRYLYEYKHLPASDWSFLWEIANYPFGFHLTVAIAATLFGVDPFYVMWIFAALLMGIVVATACTMIYSDLRTRLYAAVVAVLWAFAMFLVSPYITESYSRSGFYPMVLGLVYIVMFIWCLRCFAEITWGKIFFVSIALSGMGLTYPQWLPLLFLMYAYLVYIKIGLSGARRIVVLLIPIIISTAIGADFVLRNWDGLKYIYNIEGGVSMDSRYLAILAGGSFLLLLSISFKKMSEGAQVTIAISLENLCRDYIFVLLIVVGLVGLVVISKVIAGFGGMYPIYKYAYVLTPLFILFLSQSYVFRKGEGIREQFKIAIPAVVLLGTLLHFGLHKFSPAIQENEFNALKWVKKNIANDSVTYLNEAPFPLFGYAITGKPQTKGEFEWWVHPSPQFEAWKSQAGPGEIAIRSYVREDVVEKNNNGNFQVLYKDGDCVVIKKI